MQALKIPYQIVHCCTGDIPFPNRRMYDLEAWFPGQNKYRETQSCSNCTDFQTRRLNIKVRLKNGEVQYAHALNATALAIGRTIIAILENYQQKDGSVVVPTVLQKYVGKKKISRS
jgi:seryl-tRNA synthetase